MKSTSSGTRRSSRDQLQQGDVYFEPTVIPSEATRLSRTVVAEGEVTGHAHRVVAEPGADWEMLELGERLFIRILSGNVAVVHEEHKPIELPVGEYECGQILMYDYDAEETRKVID